MKKGQLRGLGVAVATPFKEGGEIDYDLLAAHSRWLSVEGADFLVALGTTAETPTLSPDERTRVAATICDNSCGLPVVYGLGGNSTAAVVEEMRARADLLSSFDAILSVTPYYNKPSQQGLYAHFAELAKHAPRPIILYNVPGRTGVNMLPETTIKLCREFNGRIIGVKEASGSIDAIKEIIDAGVTLFSGDDNTAHETIKAGGAGVISVAGNAFPAMMARLARLSGSQDTWQEARDIHSRMAVMDKLLFRDGNPSGIKCAMSLLPSSRWTWNMRLPLVPVTDQTRAEMAKEIKTLLNV